MGTVLLFAFCTVFYFLPTLVAGKKRNANAIFMLNLLLGWSIIGWIVAMVWATTADPPAAPVPQAEPAGSSAELERLHHLYTAGVLTADEYKTAKQRVLR